MVNFSVLTAVNLSVDNLSTAARKHFQSQLMEDTLLAALDAGTRLRLKIADCLFFQTKFRLSDIIHALLAWIG